MDGPKEKKCKSGRSKQFPIILKDESRRFKSVQVNDKKITKLSVIKFDNVKVDGLELSVNTQPNFNCTLLVHHF